MASGTETDGGDRVTESLRSKLTYANVMSTLAAFLALAGGTTAIALSGKNSVKKGDIAKNAVRAREIVKGGVLTGEVKNETLLAGDLAAGSVGAGELLDGGVGTADQADVPVVRVEQTSVPAADNAFVEVEFSSESNGENAFDPFDMFDPAEPSGVEVPIAGVYLIGARVVWPLEDDQGHREVRLLVDGMIQPPETRVPARANELIIQEANGIANLVAGDRVRVAIVQDDDGGESVTASRVTLEVVWLGPGV